VNLTWGDSTDTGGSGLKGYNLYRKMSTDSVFTFVKQVSAPAGFTSDLALASATTYNYYVRAIDNAGNLSDLSNVASATTPACLQPTPTVTSTPGAATGTYQWSQRYGGTGTDVVNATAIDKRANCDGVNGTNCIIVTGRVNGTVDFGGGPRSAVGGGGDDLFVAKYTASGGHLWSEVFGGTATDRGNAVAVDASGNVIVVGISMASGAFGGAVLPGLGSIDVIVAKYAGTNGAHLWSKRLGGTGQDYGTGVAVDASGNVIVAGSFRGPVDFGGGALTNYYGIPQTTFVAKYAAADGAYLWAKNFMSGSTDYANAVAVDANGNIVLTGGFQGIMDMTLPGSSPYQNTGAGMVNSGSTNPDVYVAKLTSTGAYVWSHSYGAFEIDEGRGIAVDSGGNVVVTGIRGGAGSITGGAAGDMFVAKYAAADGTQLWSRGGGNGTAIDTGRAVAVDSSDNVLVTGSFGGTADFGGTSLTSTGGLDIFVAKYAAATGATLWLKGYGGLLGDEGFGLAADAANNVIVTGYFSDVVNFGGGPLTSTGGFDTFVLKLTP
jgi:hypothetical protein